MAGPLASVRAAFAAIGRARRADAAGRANRARGTHCFYCGVEFRGEGKRARTIDHRIPKARGGTDAMVNLVFACQACNRRKAGIDEDTFVASDWLRDRRRDLERERLAEDEPAREPPTSEPPDQPSHRAEPPG
ncbi:MAG: HNH endonuclease signature motif containing protein [Actinomycetota bacterium]|nr:HNH endonuclease signature motif containing protein [Actinomycetota bacterium]